MDTARDIAKKIIPPPTSGQGEYTYARKNRLDKVEAIIQQALDERDECKEAFHNTLDSLAKANERIRKLKGALRELVELSEVEVTDGMRGFDSMSIECIYYVGESRTAHHISRPFVEGKFQRAKATLEESE